MSTFWRVVGSSRGRTWPSRREAASCSTPRFFCAVLRHRVFCLVRRRGGDGRALGDAAAGILWVAIAFSGTLALGRTFERERYGDTLRALLLAPGARAAVSVSWSASSRCSSRPRPSSCRSSLLFQARLGDHLLLISALLLFGTIGFATVGTLFAAMLTRARSRDVLLPILLYPVTIPVMIAGVRGTSALLAAEPQLDMARLWVMLLLAFDVVFVTLSLWTFEALMTE
jgi:heme exporter protein CcmB